MVHQIKVPKITLEQASETILYNITRSICPSCKKSIDAQILVRNNCVYMRKRCPDHGWFESLLSSDFDFFRSAERFNKPGTRKLEYQTDVQNGCPDDCGLCPEHKQHTCLALFEITTKCNLNCPICFANSGGQTGVDLPLHVIELMIKNLKLSEKNLEIVQLSGGEPTLHPDLLHIIQRLKEEGAKTIMINTNGIKFAKDPDFAFKVKKAGTTAIYLQFDGFKENTYLTLRGHPNLLQDKLQAIENIVKSGLSVTLVMTIVEDVNESEIGDVIQFMHSKKGISGISFQPFFTEGRFELEYDPLNHLTIPDILRLIEEQTDHLYQKNDFFPIPCPDPHCSACTFSYIDPETHEFTTIKRLVEVEDYLDFFTNTTLPTNAEMAIKEALESIFSMATTPGSKDLVKNYCDACGIEFNILSIQSSLERYIDNIKMITIKLFQSAWDLDVKRLMKCCIHEVLPDGKIIPFCAYNAIYREHFKFQDFIET